MTGSSRPRLRSEISRGHSDDDPSEGTSARTRPLSYGEIMRRRKSKKEIDGEEAPAKEYAGNEESVKNLDNHNMDASVTALKYSKDRAQEDGSRNMEEKRLRLEDTRNKSRNKESHDSQSKHKYEKCVTNGMEVVKPYRRGDVIGKLDENNQDMDSRSKHKHDKDVKNGPEVSKSDREGHVSGRIDEDDRDMRLASKDKHENNVKNRSPLLKGDRRASVLHKTDDENRDRDSRSKYEHRNYVKTDTQVPKIEGRGFRSGRIVEESYDMDSRSRHDHRNNVKDHAQISKNDGRGYRSGRIVEESHDRDLRSRHGHRTYVENDTQMSKTDRQGYRSGRIVEEGHDIDSRYKHDHKNYVKNDTQVSKTDGRGYRSGRTIGESHDPRAGYMDKYEKTVKNSTQSLTADRRGNVRDKPDSESRDVDSRSKNKHEKERINNAEDLKNSRQVHVRSKQGEILRDSAKYDNDDRHHRDSVAQNRNLERSRGESENEKKRKDRSIDDERYRPRDSVKKHDTGHRLGSDMSGKEKMESSDLRRDESRSKRRRSRSQEPSKSKGRRSKSASPKAQKIAPSLEHDHGHLSSHSQKEISRPKNDVDRSNTERSRPNHDDRSNTESNGTIGHHRQQSGFSSGLGGYSPRKRKTDAAIKTPSPIHSPERRSAGWDPPQPVSQIMSSNKIDLAIGGSVALSMGMPLSTTFFHGLSTFKDASVDSVQLTQATRPMRRLYIDNIPASTSEKEIMESFNTYLLYSGSNHIRGTRPCISCMINKEKGQALLEFLTPEDASAALSFDGRPLYGSMLKIRRPKDYVELTSGSAERLKAGAGRNIAVSDVVASDVVKDVAISDSVKDSPHKIFVGGVAEGLSSEMIMEIFSVFGPLKAFRFTNENLNEPCVFLEYADQSITSKACAALNGMKLGGRILTVALAIPDTSFKGNLETEPFYGIPEHVKTLLEKPTLVLKLSNVLDQKATDSLPESDLEEIMEDVRLECSRFGSVVSINAVMTSNMHTTDSKLELIDEKLPLQPREEREAHDHYLNKKLIKVDTGNDESKGNDGEPLTNSEQFDISKSVEGDKHDLVIAPAIEVEASGTSTLDAEEVDTAAIGTPIENTEILQDSDGNHEKPVEGNVGSSITDPNENTVNVKLDDNETSHVDDVEQLDKSTGKQPEEVVSVSRESPSKNQGTNISDVRNIFEVGCILVEFKRTEASCMAAHSLHGRLFDDRIVTVEYVPHEAYQAMFPK